MKLSLAKHKLEGLLLLLTIFLFLTPNIFGQLTKAEKIAQAKIAYDEAFISLNKQTAEGYKESFANFEKAKQLYEEVKDELGLGKSLSGMALVHSAFGEESKAIEIYDRVITIFQKLSEKQLEAIMLNNAGLSYGKLGEHQKALEYLLKSLAIRKAIKDIAGEANVLNSIGYTYTYLGEREKAFRFYREALQIRLWDLDDNDLSNKKGRAIILNNLGNLHKELGETEKAIRYLNQSLFLRQQVKDKFGEATTLNNLCLIYSDLSLTQKALDSCNRALSIYQELDIEAKQSTISNNIGAIYADLGESSKALESYEKALLISRKYKNQDSESVALSNLGYQYIKLNQFKKGFDHLNEALIIQKTTGNRIYEAITLRNLMNGWSLAGNKQLSVFYGKQSVNKYQELRKSIKGLEVETQKKYLKTIEYIYRELADLLIEEGRFAQAEQVLRMLKEEEYFDFVRRDADEIKTLDQRISLDEQEKKLIERYAVLANRVTEIGEKFSALDNKKQNTSLSVEEQKQYKKLENQLAVANAAFKLFLDKELVAELSKPSKKGIEYDRSLQAKLKKWGEGTVMLYTVVSKDRYRVILTTPNVQVDGKTEISALELNKKIFAYRDALQDIKIDPRPLGKELYDILIKPIEKHLRDANAKTLVWSLDGTLRYIPIATLSPDGRSYLVEQYRNVITTPKTRDDVSDTDTEWRALGVGVSESQTVTNPDNSDEEIDFIAIPGTKQELMTIIKDETSPNEKGILNGRRFIDKEFTISSLSESLATKTSDGKRKYTAVHIASHFQLGSNWANSFLLLGNGQILTLKELKNSPNLDFGDVELVTLSACDTAFTADSNGKEVDSLASVIQSKSGKAVLAALWAVADESTPLLMSEFYRLRKENPKMTKAEAMQTVQQAFVKGELKPSAEYTKQLDDYYKAIGVIDNGYKFYKNAPFAHPYFWSPFVLIGNWR